MTANTQKAEVIVLGAGMVGVSTALALQDRGHWVCLVDRRVPGRETSYGNAGIIQREAVLPYPFPRKWQSVLRVATRRGNDVNYHANALPSLASALTRYWHASEPERYAEAVAAYSAVIRHCIDEHAPLIKRADAQDLIQKNGYLKAFRTQKAFDVAAREASETAIAHGLDCMLLNGTELAADEPALQTKMAGAIHWKEPWTVSDPGELVARYARLFRLEGGTFATGDAETLVPTESGWKVNTAGGPVEAEHVVVALGPWSVKLTTRLGYRLPLFVKRGYHRHYSGGATLSKPVLDMESGFLLAPMRLGLRLTTGAEFAVHESAPTPTQLSKAELIARELIELGEPVEAEPWMGARPCVADMRPVVGRASRHRNLWFHFGHGHQGFTLGPATARLLAELFGGTQPYVAPAPYDPLRHEW